MSLDELTVPEGGVGWFKQGFVSEESGAGSRRFITEVCGDVFGRGAPEDLQPFLQHLLPALQRLQHGVTQWRAHRQICTTWRHKHTAAEPIAAVSTDGSELTASWTWSFYRADRILPLGRRT